MHLFKRYINPYLIENQTRIEASMEQLAEVGRSTVGIPGSGLQKLADLCRSIGIPVGSDSSEIKNE